MEWSWLCARRLASPYRRPRLNHHVLTREEDAGVHRHIQRNRGSGPGVQPNERVGLPRGERQLQCRHVIEVNRRIGNAWCSFRKYTLELYDRPSAPLELKTPIPQSRDTRDNAVRLRRVEPARVPLWHTAPSPRQFLDLLGLLAQRAIAPTIRFPSWRRLLSRREVRVSRRLSAGGGSCSRDLWRAWRIRDCRSAWCSENWGGGRGLCEGAGNIMDGVFPGRPQSFRHQRRPVDDCSPGRGGNGTRGGTFHGEMGRCREIQGWTTACSSKPAPDGKGQGKDSPKQAGSCWFARHSWLVKSGANLYPPGVWFADALSSFPGATFVLVSFRFRLYTLINMLSLKKPRPFVQSFFVLRYACVPTAIHVFLPFLFFLFCRERSLFRVFFPSIFCTITSFLFIWRVRRTFPPSGWCFSTLWPRAGFFTSGYYVGIQSINTQSLN